MNAAGKPVVIKLGSSVLAGPRGFADGVDRIARFLQDGRSVCVVVSATPGTTDGLWRDAHALAVVPRPRLLGSLLATGEQVSVSLLGIALAARGIESECLDVAQLDLRVEGDPLDAVPIGLSGTGLSAALGRAGVVVVPGFVGRDASGAIHVLGRGGSDLTALVIARTLGAECVLFKDVDGLYEADPKTQPGPMRRYVQANWEEVARVGGDVVQRKAIDFAREHRLEFAIVGPSGVGTQVGELAVRYARVAS
ncbi:MAG: hypothetical protein GKS06_02065 [Acidobacteria bacterium]|nr:hypothetical protein [Acidobacteriota bacterium]